MKKYKIIYADPPWRYARSKVQGAAEKHYPTMSIEELCALPVKEIAEICLLATKGHPKRQSNKVHQFIISPVEQHSKKPDITREKILALMGDLPRIELFARQHTPGWDVWGNEIKSDIRFAGKEV